MRKLIVVLCTMATLVGLSIFGSFAASAGGPTDGVNVTASLSFSIVSGHFETNCFLGRTDKICSPGRYGKVSAPGGYAQFIATPGYAVPVGGLLYAARGHEDHYSVWYGAKTPMYVTIGGVKYHIVGGYIAVLRAQTLS